jgi:hypothetical protein
MKTKAAKILDVNESTLKHFDVEDTFNGNRIEGFLAHQSDHRYGAMVIFRVNGEETEPQVVYATPKLHYPFDRVEDSDSGRRFKFPEFVKVKVYPKLDGTNICCYSYADMVGNRFVSFKTRLTPVLRDHPEDSPLPAFKSMWLELLKKYPYFREPEAVKRGLYSLSFEMYGFRNPHLIQYPEPLETRLLFAVDQSDGTVVIPDKFDFEAKLIPEAECSGGEDLVAFYNDKREEARAQNEATEDNMIIGTEGYIFYVLTVENKWVMFKCKSSDVESIHWADGALPMDVILPTCWNALESVEELTVEAIEQLLAEEFTPQEIIAAKVRIEKAIAHVKERLVWREKVLTVYKTTGLSFEVDGKGQVMKVLSQYFDKRNMRRVFTALKELGIVDKSSS